MTKSITEHPGFDIEALAIRLAGMIAPLLQAKAPTIPFSDAAIAFIKAGGSPRFLGPGEGIDRLLGHLPLSAISQALIDDASLKLYPTALPLTRIRQFYAPFRAVWNFAVLEGWAKDRKWRLPREAKGTRSTSACANRSGSTPTSYDRAAEFVCAMSPAPGMVMTALFFTGMRPIELFALEAADVDVAKRWLVVRASKTGEPRGVPIHEFLAPVLESLCARGGKVFRTHKGEPYPLLENAGGQMKSAIRGARRRTGIKDISPYTARHTVSTQLVVNGAHPYVKDQILGHAVDDMSRRYTNVPQQPLIDAINGIAVPERWQKVEWLADPLAWSRKLVNSQEARRDRFPLKLSS
jgi:integrase/recombinase XerD